VDTQKTFQKKKKKEVDIALLWWHKTQSVSSSNERKEIS
jgi:hypothetical protein